MHVCVLGVGWGEGVLCGVSPIRRDYSLHAPIVADRMGRRSGGATGGAGVALLITELFLIHKPSI